MTNKEVERAIDFLLKSQANCEARIEQTNEQLASFADTQREIMQIMTHTLRVQSETDESLRANISELAARQTKTEEALARLAVAQESSERRLEALTKIVEEERRR